MLVYLVLIPNVVVTKMSYTKIYNYFTAVMERIATFVTIWFHAALLWFDSPKIVPCEAKHVGLTNVRW